MTLKIDQLTTTYVVYHIISNTKKYKKNIINIILLLYYNYYYSIIISYCIHGDNKLQYILYNCYIFVVFAILVPATFLLLRY